MAYLWSWLQLLASSTDHAHFFSLLQIMCGLGMRLARYIIGHKHICPDKQGRGYWVIIYYSMPCSRQDKPWYLQIICGRSSLSCVSHTYTFECTVYNYTMFCRSVVEEKQATDSWRGHYVNCQPFTLESHCLLILLLPVDNCPTKCCIVTCALVKFMYLPSTNMCILQPEGTTTYMHAPACMYLFAPCGMQNSLTYYRVWRGSRVVVPPPELTTNNRHVLRHRTIVVHFTHRGLYQIASTLTRDI